MKWILVFAGLIAACAGQTIKAYECDVTGYYYCSLKGIELSLDDFHFQPLAEDFMAIRSVSVQQSKIPVLAGDICETFPNLEFLEIHSVGLKDIFADAFSDCKQLKELRIIGNKISRLEEDVFADLSNLKVLYLTWNRLKTLPVDIFQGLNLESLYLDGNGLTTFSTELVRGLDQLTSLSIASNSLFDFDIEGLLQILPRLKVFSFDENNLNCERVSQIDATAENLLLVKPDRKPYRSSGVEKFEGYACLRTAQWLAEYQRAIVESQTAKLREL